MILGKLPPRLDARGIGLRAYLNTPLLVPPAVDWTGLCREGWPMYANDRAGTCVFAAVAHLVHAWSAAAGREAVLTEPDVLAAYRQATGYDPEQPETDRGAVVLDVLKAWRARGIAGHRLGAFAGIDPTDLDRIRAAIALFRGCVAGLQLPLAAKGREVWDTSQAQADTTAIKGSWDGHCVTLLGWGERGLLGVSFGRLQWMTWPFFAAYADEAWACLSEDFLVNGRAPTGLDLASLRADLARVASAPLG